MRHLLISAVLCLALLPAGIASAQEDAPSSFAEIDILVQPGAVRIDRIAVPPAIPSSGTIDSAMMVTETIRRCLQIAGPFEVYGEELDADAAENGPMNAMEIELWASALAGPGEPGVDRVHAEVIEVMGEVALDFRLYSGLTRAPIDIGFDPVLVPRDEIRRETFRFVNLIVEYYTGAYGPFDGRIAAVARDRDGNKQIVTMNVDGSELAYFTSADTIHVVPEYGSDGRIYYTSYANGNPDLFVDGSVFSAREGMNMGASVSPAGSEVAASLSYGGTTDIYVMDSRGEVLRQCTSNSAEDMSPSWSPDGGMLAFVSDRSGGPQVFVMNSDCSGPERVTFEGPYNTTPDWSPRGHEIAYTSQTVAGNNDIFAVEIGGLFTTRRITQDQGSNEHPSWAPGGNYLVFASRRHGEGSRLYVSTADGHFQTAISPPGYEVMTPSWGP